MAALAREPDIGTEMLATMIAGKALAQLLDANSKGFLTTGTAKIQSWVKTVPAMDADDLAPDILDAHGVHAPAPGAGNFDILFHVRRTQTLPLFPALRTETR